MDKARKRKAYVIKDVVDQLVANLLAVNVHEDNTIGLGTTCKVPTAVKLMTC